MNNISSSSSTPTKEHLASFKARHNRWKNSPRPKLVPMPTSPLPSAEKNIKDLERTSAAFSPPPKEAKASLSQKDDNPHRSRLVEFYTKHNKSKLDTVDETLAKFKGKEEELFRKLQAKYTTNNDVNKSKFPLPSGDGPLCYLKFTVDGKDVGKVTVKLYQDKAPLASKNFKCLCTGEVSNPNNSTKKLCYQGSKAHRIVPNFCVQMGDFTRGDGRGGQSIYPPNTPGVSDAWGKFKDEMFMQHSKPGLLSMANSGKNSNSSQVFFTLKAVPYLDGKHVVFGEVLNGMDVIQALGKVKTNQKTQVPLQPVIIDDCGELKDGQEISCKINLEDTEKKGPFGLSTLSTPSSTFGVTRSTSSASKPISFPSSTKSPFTFGDTLPNKSKASPFSFGSSSSSTSNVSFNATSKSPFAFGGTSSATGTTGFSFGAASTTTKDNNNTKESPATADGQKSTIFKTNTASKSPFTFGAPATLGNTGTPSFPFGAKSSGSSTNTSSSPFTFGSKSSTSNDKSSSSPFTFGATASPFTTNAKTQFSFGAPPKTK